jgi:uncharacterized protein Yka (UPF0111/DUF47 family)
MRTNKRVPFVASLTRYEQLISACKAFIEETQEELKQHEKHADELKALSALGDSIKQRAAK